MPEIIFDTNVLSNFSLAGRLDLLRELYPTSACCTLAVRGRILKLEIEAEMIRIKRPNPF